MIIALLSFTLLNNCSSSGQAQTNQDEIENSKINTEQTPFSKPAIEVDLKKTLLGRWEVKNMMTGKTGIVRFLDNGRYETERGEFEAGGAWRRFFPDLPNDENPQAQAAREAEEVDDFWEEIDERDDLEEENVDLDNPNLALAQIVSGEFKIVENTAITFKYDNSRDNDSNDRYAVVIKATSEKIVLSLVAHSHALEVLEKID